VPVPIHARADDRSVKCVERSEERASRFIRAGRLLLSLAVAENETWANNATAQFQHLFQAQLAGTEAPPSLRLKLLDDVLAEEHPVRTNLAIRALGVAIGTRHFTRTVGPEAQGSRRYDDWTPNTDEELLVYFNGCLDRLVRFAQGNHELGGVARKQLADGIRTQVFVGNLDGIDAALRSVRSVYHESWPEALAEAADAVRYEGKGLDPDDQARVFSWRELLSPTNLLDRLDVYVKNAAPGWGLADDAGVQDITRASFEALVSDIAQDSGTWPTVITALSIGEQNRTFDFAERLGASADPFALLTLALNYAEETCASELNPSFIAGVLSSIKKQNEDRYRSALNRSLLVEAVVQHFVWINAAVGLLSGDLARLGRLLSEGRVSQQAFRVFTYGRILLDQPADDIVTVFSLVVADGVEGGWTTIGVLGMYLDDNRILNACRDVLSRAVLSTEIALNPDVSTMDRYSFGKICQRLLQDVPPHANLVLGLVDHAVKLCGRRNIDTNTYDMIRPIVFELLKEQSEVAWPVIRDAITAADGLTQFHWSELLTDSKPMQAPTSAFDLIALDLILSWIRSAPSIALHVVLRELPLFSVNTEGAMAIHPLVAQLFDEFGDEQSFLSTISANLHSFGFVGSTEHLFRARASFLERFRNHRRPSVAAWAAAEKAAFERSAESERLRQEAWDAGIISAPFH
jgi:hypothetical protein